MRTGPHANSTIPLHEEPRCQGVGGEATVRRASYVEGNYLPRLRSHVLEEALWRRDVCSRCSRQRYPRYSKTDAPPNIAALDRAGAIGQWRGRAEVEMLVPRFRDLTQQAHEHECNSVA
jgi:hypothetical protein